jgi:hypothetical protein
LMSNTISVVPYLSQISGIESLFYEGLK